MFEVFTGEISFLNILSLCAFFTTVGLFFCGIPICRQIWKRKDTNEISGAPFLMGVLGGFCWMTYGILKNDETVKYVTSAQVVLYSVYTVYYFFMTKKKFWISIQITALTAICTGLFLSQHFFKERVLHPLGIVCLTLNIADFAAPLAGLKVVIRRGATSTLPLPLCIANFLVSSEWFIYGLLKGDFYLIFPNGVGSFLAFCQLILFIVLPRKPKQRAPIVKLFFYIKRCGAPSETDIETSAVVPPEKEPDSRLSKRWSKRLAASMASVTSEIEEAMSKVQMGGQFGYSAKLNTLEDIPSDTATLDSAVVTPNKDPKEIKFPMTITSEEQLMQLSKTLMHKLSVSGEPQTQVDRAPLPEHFGESHPSGTISASSSSSKLERCRSEPSVNK
ncbi:unnamed protein product [Bursaphelenchus okinawaensis]|uniref:Sugar transporter SWEET1 n=1 Tax=Bursaphelenchus okinawaensis TaxID=465554 RepID=A0A811KRE9_9BILA|nr:unnamed protein product [Bursaphelenchus okinawaensis]CAG9112327.1 unnamed protein product [Bursaphelenchus okinawaensis]